MSFSKAADHLFITQQGLSHSIKSLEQELGVELFMRNNQGVQLTETAELMQNEVAGFLQRYDELYDKFQTRAETVKGVLRLAVPPGITNLILPELYSGFKTAYPQIELIVHEVNDIICERMLLANEVDIAFTIGPVDEDEFDYQTIAKNMAYLYVNRRNPLSMKESVSFSDLKAQRFLLIDDTFKWYHNTLACCRNVGYEPNIYHVSSQVSVLANLVRKNLGITMFASMIANGFLDSDTALVPIEPFEEFNWQACLITRKNHRVKYLARLLKDYIAESFVYKPDR